MGVGGWLLMIKSMKMESAQDVRMKVRESIHFPPGMRVPEADLWSMAGLFQAYCVGVHWSMLPRVVLMA
jgi:hypothetical protein